MAGLYFHIPFCKQACYYCDFHFSTQKDLRSEMIQSMNQELLLQKDYLGSEGVETIYFGGGTPSIIQPAVLAGLLDNAKSFFKTSADAEITIECNPDDLNPQRLVELAQVGVNRLSIGIQSFDDTVLHYFNRAHTAAESVQCVVNARQAGFKNISIDLIYGIPGQGRESWLANIRKAIALETEHISAYALTIEDKTVFGKRAAKGLLTPLPEENVAQHFEILMEEMANAGYDHYEISNFSKPGRHSRHNTSYWEQKTYLGIGPSAHSYNGRSRQHNIANNALYIKSIRTGVVPCEREDLGRETLINEYIMTRLRTSDGVDLKSLKEVHGFDLLGMHSAYIQNLLGMGKILLEGNFLKLSNQGKLLADKISADLFVIAE